MRFLKLLIILSMTGFFFGCSKDSGGSSNSEKNTLFKGKTLQTIVEENFALAFKDCDKDYVTMTSGAERDHIYINEHKDRKYALFLETIMSKGKIKLTFTFSEVLSPVGVSTTKELLEPFTIMGAYKINNRDGLGAVIVNDVEVGTFTYGGTYNSLISLSFDYNSKILQHFPDVPEMKDTDFLDIFDDRKFWVKSAKNVTSANFKKLCDVDKIFDSSKNASSVKIEQFLVNYLPPKEITDKVGASAKLTYSMKVKTDDFGGDYSFFDCLDSECVTKYLKFVVECDETRNCQGFDGSGNKVGTPDHVWTFAYLWHPIYNPKTKKYDTWTGLDLQFVDPDSLGDGFHDQYHAAQFEDLSGIKSNLEIFHFKK